MDWNRVEGNWKQVKGKIKEQWGKLTDDDLDAIEGGAGSIGRQNSGALRNSERPGPSGCKGLVRSPALVGGQKGGRAPAVLRDLSLCWEGAHRMVGAPRDGGVGRLVCRVWPVPPPAACFEF